MPSFHQPVGHFHRFLVGNLLNGINHGQLQIAGYKACANALNFMRSGFHFLLGECLGNDRRVGGLYRDRLNRLAFNLFDIPGNTGNRSTRAYTRDQDVDFAIRVIPDFRSGGFFMDGRVGWILELLEQNVRTGLAA